MKPPFGQLAWSLSLGLMLLGCEDSTPTAPTHPAVGVVHPPLPGTGASPFGINAHLAGNEMLDTLADAGIVWYRIDFNWFEIEPQEGQFDWQGVDRVVDWAQGRDCRLLGVLAYAPAWASGSSDTAAPPRDPADYLNFVRGAATRYAGRVHAFSIWNEPNLQDFFKGTQSFYIRELLIPGLQALRAAAPGALTVGPDLSSAGDVRTKWLDPILKAVHPDLLDVVSHHQYDGQDRPDQRGQAIDLFHQRMVQRGYGDKPLWITETGWNTGGRRGFSDGDQVRFLDQFMAEMAKRPFWTKTFWYDSHGPGFGLLEPDGSALSGTPRPAYFAYRDLIATSGAPQPGPAPVPSSATRAPLVTVQPPRVQPLLAPPSGRGVIGNLKGL